MSSKLDALRIAIRNEALPLSERRTAAEHYVAELVDAVQEPGPDDAEVVELRTPWKGDALTGNVLSDAWKQRNIAYGWSAEGPTPSQSIKRVAERRKLRALLGTIVDEGAHKLERSEACRVVLDEHLDSHNHYRRNNFTADDLLAKVLPASATKYGGWNKPAVPVLRPPQTLADVW